MTKNRRGRRKNISTARKQSIRKASNQIKQNENLFKSAMKDVESYKELVRAQYNDFLIHIESSERNNRTAMLGFAIELHRDSPDTFNEQNIKQTAESLLDWVTGGKMIEISKPPENMMSEEEE